MPRLRAVAIPGALAAALILVAGAARAECVADADCGHGFTCEVVGGTGCATPACPPDASCPDPVPCVEEEFRDCVPAECKTDLDCADDMVCLEYQTGYCEGSAGSASPGCDPGAGDCPMDVPPPEPPPESTCTVKTQHQCAPKYLAPCDVAADCGPGFECTEVEICAGGTDTKATPEPAESGGAQGEPQPVPDPPPPIDCEPSGVKQCQLVVVDCTTAADCPEDFTCELYDAPCTRPEGGDAGGCEMTEPVAGQCMPPYAGGIPVSAGDPSSPGEPPRGDTGSSSPEEPTATPTDPVPPGDPSSSGSGEGAGVSADADADANAKDPGAANGGATDGGCSLGGRQSTSGAFLLALACLGLGRRRGGRSRQSKATARVAGSVTARQRERGV